MIDISIFLYMCCSSANILRGCLPDLWPFKQKTATPSPRGFSCNPGGTFLLMSVFVHFLFSR